MLLRLFERPEGRMLVALAVGLLIGVDRERRKGEGGARGYAGLRTFALAGLIGGGVGLVGQPLLTAVAGLMIGAAILAGYMLGERRDPGLTTEVAFFATFLLGVIAASRPVLAGEAGVVVAALLAWRTPLHRLVRESLSEQELLDGLSFAIAALVVLPLLPDRAIDPWGLINPFLFWRPVVVLMGLSALGYVALRLAGARYGLLVAGLAGGLVSSTATIAAMAGRARAEPRLVPSAAAGGVASMLSSLAYLCALVASARPQLLVILAVPMAAGALGILAYSALLARRSVGAVEERVDPGRAFNLKVALLFVVLVTLFTLLARGLDLWLGEAGILAGAALTGLVDAHAAAVSMGALAVSGAAPDHVAAVGVLLGLSANMLVKAPTAFVLGGRAYGLRVSLGAGVLVAGLWAGAAVQGGWLSP